MEKQEEIKKLLIKINELKKLNNEITKKAFDLCDSNDSQSVWRRNGIVEEGRNIEFHSNNMLEWIEWLCNAQSQNYKKIKKDLEDNHEIASIEDVKNNFKKIILEYINNHPETKAFFKALTDGFEIREKGLSNDICHYIVTKKHKDLDIKEYVDYHGKLHQILYCLYAKNLIKLEYDLSQYQYYYIDKKTIKEFKKKGNK